MAAVADLQEGPRQDQAVVEHPDQALIHQDLLQEVLPDNKPLLHQIGHHSPHQGLRRVVLPKVPSMEVPKEHLTEI
jgi:hypothetical protein